MQSTVDLSEAPGFQAHNMSLHFFFMKEDVDSMFNATHMGFEHYRAVVAKLDDKAKETQWKKEELFIQTSQEALEKHFPRWLTPELLPAALLSENDTAIMAAVFITKAWDYGRYHWYDNKFFYSEAHGRRLKLKDYGMFLENYIDKAAEHSPQATKVAECALEGFDFRYSDLDSVDDEDEAVTALRSFMFATYLPIPSHAQFVEFGVKEAKHVSQTNRSEEMRSCYGIVRSAHVTDAGNSRSGTSTQDMIVNRIKAARSSADEHVEMQQDDDYQNRIDVVLSLLRRAHFKQVRVDLNKNRIDERVTNDKNLNKAQQAQPQQLTAAVTGHVLFGKLVQRLHVADLGAELVERGVPIEELLDTITTRKLWLQELEVLRLIEEEDMPMDHAEEIGRKQFEVLSDADFSMVS
mgnify:CR=1 FL=1